MKRDRRSVNEAGFLPRAGEDRRGADLKYCAASGPVPLRPFGPPPPLGGGVEPIEQRGGPVLIEGYASLFGVEDLAGDVVRAGAFARSLARGPDVAMLLQHRGGAPVGRWVAMREDGRGLYVRGLIDPRMRAGAAALKLVRDEGMGGLSIGFIARDWSPRVGRGRELREVELREVSLVMSPMLPGARFEAMLAQARGVAA